MGFSADKVINLSRVLGRAEDRGGWRRLSIRAINPSISLTPKTVVRMNGRYPLNGAAAIGIGSDSNVRVSLIKRELWADALE